MTILLTLLLGATTYTGTHAQGVQAYENENYTQAIDYLEELVYNRVYEAEVFYNLGNTYYKTGDMPAAIVNYERALRIDSTLSVAQDNLNQAVNQTQMHLARPRPKGLESSLYFWHNRLTPSTSLSIAMVCWLLMWGGLITRTIRPTRYIRRISCAIGVIAIVFWGSWMLKTHPMELAVVQGDNIPVRIGTKETDSLRFELFSGDRVHIDAHNGEQVLVQTANGDRGWTNAEFLIPVWPPQRGQKSSYR